MLLLRPPTLSAAERSGRETSYARHKEKRDTGERVMTYPNASKAFTGLTGPPGVRRLRLLPEAKLTSAWLVQPRFLHTAAAAACDPSVTPTCHMQPQLATCFRCMSLLSMLPESHRA